MKSFCLGMALVSAAVVTARADATLVFNEIMYHPATNEPAMEWVELYNQLAVDLDVSGWTLGGEVDFRFPANTRVAGRGFVVVAIDPAALTAATGAAPVLGPFSRRLSNAGGTLRLRNHNDRLMDEVTYGTEGDWPVAADGAGPSLAKLDEDFGSADAANWGASSRLGGTPGRGNQPRTTYTTTARTLVPLDQAWRYDQSGMDRGTGWKEPGYDDLAWASGRGVLAVESHAVVTPLINTVLSLTSPSGQRVVTYYFRTQFTFTNDPAQCLLSAANLLDDGAVVYLNGTEIYRYRVPLGQNYQTLAENQPNEGAFETLTFSSPALRQGDNVLAVEVHQVNTGSSDVVFGLRLEEVTTVTNTPPEAAAGLPVAFNEMSSVTNAQFWIELVNLGTQSVALDGCVLTRFGSPTNREYVLPPQTLPAGGYRVLDRATLGFGADPGDRVVLYGPGKTTVLDAVVAKRYARARRPEGTGAWLVPELPTPGAANQFALPTDVVINEIMYQHKPFPSSNGVPAQPNPEEWVELYNRGTDAVDLGGWELEGGLSYAFPPGTSLEPDGYLVVARDAAALRRSYAALAILGDYSGRLSSKGERLRLLDAAGNPADEVYYHAGGRWPRHPGGGGASLELRDPFADNSQAEAWDASDESGKSAWQAYSYQMVAQPSLTPNPDGTWREFLLGLLAAGECLIDDVSVVQSPANGPIQLIDNGGFDSGLAGWRVLGTHSASRVISDPDNPGNPVLHLIATGPQEHMHNHIATTLAGGRSVVNGQLYEVSYRVKWLAGNSLLNTRLWFNRVARSTEMAVPQRNGTPGARNSRHQANIGPTFAQLQHQPVVPAAGAGVTVSVRAQDPQGVSSCTLWWSVNGGTFASASMTLEAGGLYVGAIPGQAAGAVVQFYVRAVDGLGAAAMFPARGPDGGALYKVNDGQANVALAHNMRIITTPANATLLHASSNVMSNDKLPATLIYDERIAYYDVGVRLKASMNGRNRSDRVGFHLTFQPDQPFRGVHPVMGMDRRPGDTSPKNEEIVVRHAALAAGGVPTMQMDICRVLAPRSTENGPAILTPSYEDVFIETAFENGGDGTMYEMEIIYYATTANAEGYKLPQPNATQGVEIENHGDDRERYRYNFVRKNHRDADDYSQFIAFAKPFGLSGTALETQTRQLMDLDQWLRAYAIITLFGVDDTYSFWLNHNLMIYFRPSDHKAVYLMWDSDFAFKRSATSAVVGDKNLGKIVSLPSNLRVLYANLLDVMETTYNTSYLGYWLAHYGPLSGEDYTPRNSYIQQRSDYVKGIIASAGGHTPFRLNATDLTVSGTNLASLTGSAPVQVKTLTVNGVAWPVTWTTLTSWTLRLPLSAATNTLDIAALDSRGNVLTNVTATAVYQGTPDDPADRVVFSEIHCNPFLPGAEFVEFFNTSTHTTFDLSGWRVNGLSYAFPAGSLLAPRSYLVLAKNRSVFAATYGNAVPMFDEFDGELQRDGETLTLLRPGVPPGGELVVDKVRYEPVRPWPVGSNGVTTASSLQLVDAAQDNSRPLNWSTRYSPAVWTDAVFTPAITNEGWVFFSWSGVPYVTGGDLKFYLDVPGSVFLDDLRFVAADDPGGVNLLANGDFETGGLSPWTVLGSATNSAVKPGAARSGSQGLELKTVGTAGSGARLQQRLSNLAATNVHTLSFYYFTTAEPNHLSLHLSSDFRTGLTNLSPLNIQRHIAPASYIPAQLLSPALLDYTPGAANTGVATLMPVPSLWLNELQPVNLTGPADAEGQREPWIELYNAGTNAVSLAGYYLADNYTHMAQWAFPAGATLQPGEFKVIFADGHPHQTTATEWHTSFRLDSVAGSVALARLTPQPEVLDYLNYFYVRPDTAYGAFPDGQPFTKAHFHYVTPGAPNDDRLPPARVHLNEWMAANAATLADPADGNFDDWFELYNPSDDPVDLTGYGLTDTLNTPFKYRITTNGPHVLAPRGYLLVWADEETGQNTAGGLPRADLHVNFKLAAAGEAIGLFDPEGQPVDTVAFGPQTTDVSEGRYPDGSATIVPMPGSASPRAANHLLGSGNLPPELHPLGDRIVYLGQFLAFTASASDPDGPAAALTFTLEPVPPAGAAITESGAFSWIASSVGVHPLTVRVTDSGTPPLSATGTMRVEVLPLPELSGAVLHEDRLLLSWEGRSGERYVVDYKEALNAPVWLPLWTNTAASGSVSFFTVTTNAAQRFYRLRTGEE